MSDTVRIRPTFALFVLGVIVAALGIKRLAEKAPAKA